VSSLEAQCAENQRWKEDFQELMANQDALKYSLTKLEQIRKLQQQQILSLKGNMRVYCRVKPAPILFADAEETIDFPQRSLNPGVH